jgi:hypothetical protein
MNVYGRSKLVSVLAGYSLCQRWADEGVVVQFADPGMAWTPLTSTMGREFFPWYGRFLIPAIQTIQKRMPLSWAAWPAASLALDLEERRPGLYAIPGGLRLPMHLSATERYLGRFFLNLTLDRWLSEETRRSLSEWSHHDGSLRDCHAGSLPRVS